MWIIISGCSLGSFGLTTSQLFHMACEQALHFESRASGEVDLFFTSGWPVWLNTNISWQWKKIECLLTENQDPCEAVKCRRFSNPVAQTTNKKNNNQNSKVPRLLQKKQEWAHTFFLFRSFQSSDTLITFTASTKLFLDHWSRLFCENIRNISTWKQKKGLIQYWLIFTWYEMHVTCIQSISALMSDHMDPPWLEAWRSSQNSSKDWVTYFQRHLRGQNAIYH